MNTHRRKRTDDVGEGRLAENRHIHMGTLAEEFDHFLLRRVHRVEALLRVRRVMNNNEDDTAIEGQQLASASPVSSLTSPYKSIFDVTTDTKSSVIWDCSFNSLNI